MIVMAVTKSNLNRKNLKRTMPRMVKMTRMVRIARMVRTARTGAKIVAETDVTEAGVDVTEAGVKVGGAAEAETEEDVVTAIGLGTSADAMTPEGDDEGT